MAINLKGGELTVVVANQTANIVETGLSPANMIVMFRAEGNPYPSYNPSSILNSFDQIIKDEVYLVRAINDMDNSYFYQSIPLNAGGSGTVLIGEDGAEIIPE